LSLKLLLLYVKSIDIYFKLNLKILMDTGKKLLQECSHG